MQLNTATNSINEKFRFVLFHQSESKHYWSLDMFYTASNYLLKVNDRNTRIRCEICSKLTIKTPFWCLYC